MSTRHFNQVQLADRWNISPRTQVTAALKDRW